jgi:hypothetical protein
MKIVALAFLGLVVLALAVTGAKAWQVARGIARIEAGLAAGAPTPVRDDLPDAVRTFAERGMLGADPGGVVHLRQAAEMQRDPNGDWMALTARQVIGTRVAGFAWTATMRAGPVPVVRVLDSYADGRGILDVRLFGAWRLDAFEGDEAAVAEAARYLAELPWSPDAILLNRALAWTPVKEGVEVALETPGGTARVTLHFDAAGDIVRMTAANRPAVQPDGTMRPMTWEGRYSEYREIGGRRIPVASEVGHIHDTGFAPYFRGRTLDYSVSASAPN